MASLNAKGLNDREKLQRSVQDNGKIHKIFDENEIKTCCEQMADNHKDKVEITK